MIDINESFLIVSPSLKGTIDATPKVSIQEFIDQVEPTDLVSSFLKKESFNSTNRFIVSRMMGLAQGSFFTTLKMIENKKTIIGYGTEYKNIGLGQFPAVSQGSLEGYLKHAGGSILIRPVKKLTDDEKKQALDYMKKRIGLKYDKSAIMKTAWNRLVRRKLVPFYDEKVSKSEIEKFQEPLFCSTLIAFAFRSAGIKLKLSKNIFDCWPRDFILSPDTWKVCYYQSE